MSGFTDRQVLNALLRKDLSVFVRRTFTHLNPSTEYQHGGYLDVMAHELEQVAAGRTQRLQVIIPPRHLKSITTSVAFAAWLIGHRPDMEILVASYGHELAGRHHRDFRSVVESDWYRRAFPALSFRKLAENEVVTNAGGGRRPVSVTGAVTGFGADLLILDDLAKASDMASPVERQRVKDFFEQTLVSRLNNKATGQIVSVCQRLHEDDIAAHLMGKGNFKTVVLPAIAQEDESFEIAGGKVWTRRRGEVLSPTRETLAVLQQIRLEMGNADFTAQYLQDPTSQEGSLIDWAKVEFYDEALFRSEYMERVQSWDTAVKIGPRHDYSVCTTWGFARGQWELIDLFRAKLEYPELKATALSLAAKWQPHMILVEDASSGQSLLQDLKHERERLRVKTRYPSWHLRSVTNTHNKEFRVRAEITKLEEGLLVFPADAPYLKDIRAELTGFPNAKHDDIVDSIVNFSAEFGHVGEREVANKQRWRAKRGR